MLIDVAHASSVAAGDDHSCTVLSAGTLCCWGDNDDGALGVGDTDHRDDPTATCIGVELPRQ